MRFDTHTRCLGFRPSECTAQRGKSLSSGGSPIWRHVVSHTGSGGYAEMGNYGGDPSEEAPETDGTKVYVQVRIHRCLPELNQA